MSNMIVSGFCFCKNDNPLYQQFPTDSINCKIEVVNKKMHCTCLPEKTCRFRIVCILAYKKLWILVMDHSQNLLKHNKNEIER